MWIYIDPNGDEQGPFSSSRVLRWDAKGYSDGNLQASVQAAREGGGGVLVTLELLLCLGCPPLTSYPASGRLLIFVWALTLFLQVCRTGTRHWQSLDSVKPLMAAEGGAPFQ